MPGPVPVELSMDCDSCRLEAGVAETYDVLVAACRFGLPASARCKLCGVTAEGRLDREPAKPLREVAANRCPACLSELEPASLDEHRCSRCGAKASLVQLTPPSPLSTELALIAALDAWAAREQWPSRDALLAAVFCDPDLASLLARVQRGERLEVVGDPFANMGVRTTGTSETAAPSKSERPGNGEQGTGNRERREPSHAATAPIPSSRFPVPRSLFSSSSSSPPSAPPRAILYPLVSVVAADGEIHAAERALVDRFLRGEGLAPLADDEVQVHHPSVVAHLIPKERREFVIQLMCETAAIDGMPDESERRVIRAYAAAWNVPDEKVEFWMWGYENISTSLVRQLWMKLRRFVLSARWSDPA